MSTNFVPYLIGQISVVTLCFINIWQGFELVNVGMGMKILCLNFIQALICLSWKALDLCPLSYQTFVGIKLNNYESFVDSCVVLALLFANESSRLSFVGGFARMFHRHSPFINLDDFSLPPLDIVVV